MSEPILTVPTKLPELAFPLKSIGLPTGIVIYTSTMPPFVETKIEYPQDRFVEYGPEDDWWLLKYGFAKMVTKPTKTIIQVDESMYDPFSLFSGKKKPPKIVFYMNPTMEELVLKEFENHQRI